MAQFGSADALGALGRRFESCHPDCLNMTTMEIFTVEEFQSDFDNLMQRVENGESFIIRDGNNSAVIVPYNETIKYAIESSVDDELMNIYTEHEEGS